MVAMRQLFESQPFVLFAKELRVLGDNNGSRKQSQRISLCSAMTCHRFGLRRLVADFLSLSAIQPPAATGRNLLKALTSHYTPKWTRPRLPANLICLSLSISFPLTLTSSKVSRD